MTVLHISNDFAGSKVHCNLIQTLDGLGLNQIVYCPVRNAADLGKNKFDGQRVKFVYSNIIKSWYKFVYHYKAFVLYKDLKKKINLKEVDLVHAATLFSDGFLAYKIYKEYGIPYVVAVRNTDLNAFVKLLKHTYPIGRQILLHASKVFFISKGIKQQFELTRFVCPVLKNVQNRFVLQPNGVESFWLKNIQRENREGHIIVYIGNFEKRKNVIRLIQAVEILRKDYADAKLLLVGGGKDARNLTQSQIDKHKDYVEYLGPIYDKDKLASVMHQCSVFAMPSIYETFGLVYIEALSQNLPVVYTKGQGIDGLFDDSVGIGVNPFDVNEIYLAIKKILDNPSDYSNKSIAFDTFDWNRIANIYKNYYEEILK